MSKIIFDILLPPSNWDIQRYWAIGCSRLTKSDHTWNTWWEELFSTCRKLMISLFILCIVCLHIGKWDSWRWREKNLGCMREWLSINNHLREPEGQFEDKAGCKYVQDATEALFI